MADIVTDSTFPEKKTKGELEQLVKANGGKIYQINTAAPDTICVAERSMSWEYKLYRVVLTYIAETVKVASLLRRGDTHIVKPSWLLDCVKQTEKDVGLPDFLLPFEPRYITTGNVML